jgi:DNA-3-methyladenine glycosylase
MRSDSLDVDVLDRASVLGRGFYQRPTVDVARDLLGKIVVRQNDHGRVALRLTEVEAYLGADDPACHTSGGRRTERVRSMWGPAGHAYVYLIYGLHHCLNVVTVGEAVGEAVLVRAGVPVHGVELVRRRRGDRVLDRSLSDGPGKLCQALAVTRDDDGVDLCDRGGGLWMCDDEFVVMDSAIAQGARVGVESAGDAAEWPLRFLYEPKT